MVVTRRKMKQIAIFIVCVIFGKYFLKYDYLIDFIKVNLLHFSNN